MNRTIEIFLISMVYFVLQVILKRLDSVKNLTCDDDPFGVHFISDKRLAGKVLQFRVLVFLNHGNNCSAIYTLTCFDCSSKVVGTNYSGMDVSKCPKPIAIGSYSKSQQHPIAMVFSNSKFWPNIIISVYVEGGNSAGWGFPAYLVCKNLPARNSMVSKLQCNTTPFSLTFSPPQNISGQLLEYRVVVFQMLKKHCVGIYSMMCQDCEQDINVGKKYKGIDVEGCSSRKLSKGYYSLRQRKVLTLYFNDSKLIPNSELQIIVESGNRAGWSPPTSINCTTRFFRSLPVTKLQCILNPFGVIFNRPKDPSGEILWYRASVRQVPRNNCLGVYQIYCANCPVLTTRNLYNSSNITGCPELGLNGSFYWSSPLVVNWTFGDKQYLPIMLLTIVVEARNRVGWGKTAAMKCLIDAIKSDPVRDVSVRAISLKPIYVMIKFTKPLHQYGQVGKYVIIVGTDRCIMKIELTCSGCGQLKLGQIGKRNLSKCISSSVRSYNSTETNIQQNVSAPLLFPNSEYMANISPVNAFGWGQEISTIFLTTPYIPGENGGFSLGIGEIVGIVSAVFLVLFAILLFILLFVRKSFRNKKKSENDREISFETSQELQTYTSR